MRSTRKVASIETIEGDVLHELLASLTKHPRDFVFVGRHGRPMSNNLFSKFVIRTFQRLFDGRGAGTALLRHAYVSERIDFNLMSMEQRADFARRMGHSTALQEQVYKWVDRGPWSKLDSTPAPTPPGRRKTVVTCECKTRSAV